MHFFKVLILYFFLFFCNTGSNNPEFEGVKLLNETLYAHNVELCEELDVKEEELAVKKKENIQLKSKNEELKSQKERGELGDSFSSYVFYSPSYYWLNKLDVCDLYLETNKDTNLPNNMHMLEPLLLIWLKQYLRGKLTTCLLLYESDSESNNWMKYFFRNTRFVAGYELCDIATRRCNDEKLQCDIGKLSSKFKVDFQDKINITKIMHYITDSYLRVTISNKEYLKKLIEWSFEEKGGLKKFQDYLDRNGKEFTTIDFKYLVINEFFNFLCEKIKKNKSFVNWFELCKDFTKIKLPSSDQLSVYSSRDQKDYLETLSRFLKKLVYLTVTDHIVYDLFDESNIPDDLKKELSILSRNNYKRSFLLKHGSDESKWILPPLQLRKGDCYANGS